MAINPSAFEAQSNKTVADKLYQAASDTVGSAVGGIGGVVTSVGGALNAFKAELSSAAGILKKSLQIPAGPEAVAAAVEKADSTTGETTSYPVAQENQTTEAAEEESAQDQPTPTEAVNEAKKSAEFVTFPSDLNEDFCILMTFTEAHKTNIFGKVRNTKPYAVKFPLPANLVDTVSLKYKQFGYGPLAGINVGEYIDAIRNGSTSGEVRANLNSAFERNANAALLRAIGYQYLVKPGLAAINQNIPSAVERAVGAVVNPNNSQAFETVNLRQFTFNFRFAPKSQKESKKLREILKEIKRRSLPSVTEKQPSVILGYPDEVAVEITPLGKDVFPFKKCFVQSVSFNYSPEGVLFFNDDEKHPAVIDVTIQLIETQILTRYDIDKDVGFEESPAVETSTPKPTTRKQVKDQFNLNNVSRVEPDNNPTETPEGAVTANQKTLNAMQKVRDRQGARPTQGATTSSDSSTPIDISTTMTIPGA